MGIRVGMPMLKLSRLGKQTKRKGNSKAVAQEALEERYSKDKDKKKGLAKDNDYYGFVTGKDLNDYWVKEANKHTDNLGRPIRKDAVIGFSLIVKPDMDEFSKLTKEERTKFLKDSHEIVVDILNKHGLQVDAIAVHRDELSDHSHVLGHDPEYKAGKKINLKLFRDLNREYPRQMREKGYDVEELKVYNEEVVSKMSEEEAIKYKKKHIAEKKKKKHGQSSEDYKRGQTQKKLDAAMIQNASQKAEIELAEMKEKDLKLKLEQEQEEKVEREKEIKRLKDEEDRLKKELKKVRMEKAYAQEQRKRAEEDRDRINKRLRRAFSTEYKQDDQEYNFD